MTEYSAESVSRIAAAGLAILVLSMVGIVLLAFSLERTRAEVKELRQAVLARTEPAPSPMEADVAALRQAVDQLAGKIDAIRVPDASKSVDRLAAELKTLSNRMEAMAASAKPQQRPTTETKTPTRQAVPPPEEEYPSRVFYPVYPVY
jgi:outer membrane murein-binding lipoprotein Lpp